MKKILLMALTAVSIFSATIPSNAMAGLSVVDLFAANDGLLTRDTDAGLDWLDLTATLGMSYNEASVSGFVIDHGFRFATGGEVAAFYVAAGGVNVPGSSGANKDAVLLLLDLMGCTTQCVSGEPAGQGYFEADLPPLTGSIS